MSLFNAKNYQEVSLFQPTNLLREARRQKEIETCNIPSICVLDPDGDIVDYLQSTGKASLNSCWACYHTQMYEFELAGMTVGIIGCAVGASFAVLLAEQMFVSGCEYLVSITSAGIIHPFEQQVEFMLIESALRDEGTSYHYLPPHEESTLAPQLWERLKELKKSEELSIDRGKSWTTDAPYRETPTAITKAKQLNVRAVEMEAAALYAFAKAKRQNVICFAHLTNTMAQKEGDFEKGEAFGSIKALQLLAEVIEILFP